LNTDFVCTTYVQLNPKMSYHNHICNIDLLNCT
jgi:hypothetical protein